MRIITQQRHRTRLQGEQDELPGPVAVPATHCLHDVALAWEYEPPGQMEQVPLPGAAAKEPGKHWLQEAEPAPDDDPAGQMRQAAELAGA